MTVPHWNRPTFRLDNLDNTEKKPSSVILFFVIIGLFASLIDVYAIRAVLNWLSVLGRFGNFSVGVFDYAALLYYVSIAFIFIFLTIRVYEKRRWES